MSKVTSGLNRRRFLQGSASVATAAISGAGLSACNSNGSAVVGDADIAFLHGVASGDPLADRVILWTRVTPQDLESSVTVQWQLATDPGMTDVIASGSVVTQASRDFTVKVDPTGLMAGTTYYYRFASGDVQSPIGRTRTAPVGAVDRLRVGVVSCSSLAHGLFNAYRRVAERADLDVVLHLGDYIYEYGDGEYGDARSYEPAHEIITLEDYRLRHAQYKRDADLAEAHRQHPFICVWDDHETADNSYRDGANNHTEGEEGAWTDRLAFAVQAYYEWMPIRVVDPLNPLRIYRQFKYGDLAEFDMLDTRIIDRDREVLVDEGGMVNSSALNDESRTLLGEDQLQWLSDTLNASTAQWKFLGQQVMFGQLRIVGTPDLAQLLGDAGNTLRLLPVAGTGGVILNTDQWDGYAAERRRVWDIIRGGQSAPNVAINNVVVLTGDIHTSWVMDITEDPSNLLTYSPLNGNGSMAVEFVCTSITSPGLGLPAESLVSQLVPAVNPHMKYVNLTDKGYMLLDITAERAQAEYYFVPTIDVPDDREQLGAVFATVDGKNRVVAGEASVPRENPPALAPSAPVES